MDDIPGDPALKGTKEEIRLWESKMTVDIAAENRMFFSQTKDNMVLEGDENVIEDVNRFKSTGGGYLLARGSFKLFHASRLLFNTMHA